MIERNFYRLTKDELSDLDEWAGLSRRSPWLNKIGWKDLFDRPRVLIVSEAGMGKTYECREACKSLKASGEPAFFLELASLARNGLEDLLELDEIHRFEAWKTAQSEIATFFLDSIDELKLTHGAFELALRRLRKAVDGHLGRVRLVVTTRPIPLDRSIIEAQFPVPETRHTERSAEAFADVAMRVERPKEPKKEDDWWLVGLLPLSADQIRQMAVQQRVPDPDAMLTDIIDRDAMEFAERPQDLIELCSNWREHHRIGTHREQVEADVTAKLKPRRERPERAALTVADGRRLATRLALACMLTRKLTLRHDAEADAVPGQQAALDVSIVLPDVDVDIQTTLLERPLFGFASYGRVRFHHRSVIEYLAAERLKEMIAGGTTIKSIKRLLFVTTAQGLEKIRPAMRPVAAWLSLDHDSIFSEVLRRDPSVLLDFGDPQSLSPARRVKALEAYVNRYKNGGWRGLGTPRIQVKRFATPELSAILLRHWSSVENREIQELLLELIEACPLKDCRDVAFSVATSPGFDIGLRGIALNALVALRDPAMAAIANDMVEAKTGWTEHTVRRLFLHFFPEHLPVALLEPVLRRVSEPKQTIGELTYHFAHAIEGASIDPQYLDELRKLLTKLVAESVSWKRDRHPRFRAGRQDLLPALLASCVRQMHEGVPASTWSDSARLALRFGKDRSGTETPRKALHSAIAAQTPAERERGFWNDVAWFESVHKAEDAWDRLYELAGFDAIPFIIEDWPWILARLADPETPTSHREMMLWSATSAIAPRPNDADAADLLPLVADCGPLAEILCRRLEPHPDREKHAEQERQLAEERIKQAETDRIKHSAWMRLWEAVAENPDALFDESRGKHTAWDIWRVMSHAERSSAEAGWNRSFIERHFGIPVADRMRSAISSLWRKGTPKLKSERPPEERSYYYNSWVFGLAGLAAEAEDLAWATKLSETDAKTAARFAAVNLNGFPPWLESLIASHEGIVDAVLGSELTFALENGGTGNDFRILSDVKHASPAIKSFFRPRIRTWLECDLITAPEPTRSDDRRHDAVSVLLSVGDVADLSFLGEAASDRLQTGAAATDRAFWISVLFRIDVVAAVEALEGILSDVTPSKNGPAIDFFATLFGRFTGSSLVNPKSPAFTPDLLLRLLIIAYRHVAPKNDEVHESNFTPNKRDDAEQGRNTLLTALIDSEGQAAWDAKMKMLADPLFAHFADRGRALAEERASEEADRIPMSEAAFVQLDRVGETAPTTTESMFAMLRDRLDDLDDFLLQDVSPLENWAAIQDERVLRRALADAMKRESRGMYTVDQEGVTADEKETDVRLRSTSGDLQATIELKVGEKKRSAGELRKALHDQLLVKYMAAESCRVGCLMISVNSDRSWSHPETKRRMDLNGLIAFLNADAERLMRERGGTIRIMAKGLDLRSRLPKEDA
nr:hypothetical protein [uncultured Devosia sp.]